MQFKKIYVEITNICNKNCSFCIKSNRLKREMTLDEFKLVLTRIKPFTNYIYLHIKGEPLIHSKFKEIIELCDQENIFVNITTNGTYLNKYKEVISKSSSIRQINISLHSYSNMDELDSLFDTVNYLNNKTNIYLVYRYWTMKENDNILDNASVSKLIKYYKFEDKVLDEIKETPNIKINKYLYINKDKEFIWPSLENNIYEEKGTCYGLKTHIGILSDGTVVPCCLDGEGTINLGNIFKENLEDILNAKRTKEIVENFKQNKKIEELCRHCSFKK